MIVIPPQDPNKRPSDPIAEALAPLYDQFTNVQNLAEFHAALRKRDALYEIQHQEMGENPQDFENLHPRDFYRQFDRRAEEDDNFVVSEAPYRIREQLRDVLWGERDTAKSRALETYKKLFIDHHLAQFDRDRLYYLGKVADAASDQDRERYLTALIGRLKLSGEVGLLHKEDADRLIENIPSDLDIFSFNREFASDPARAQRLLLYGAYPNIRPELREELVKAANDVAAEAQEEEIPPQGGGLDEEPRDENAEPEEEQTQEEEQPAEEDETEPQPSAPQPATPPQRKIAPSDKKPPPQQTETPSEARPVELQEPAEKPVDPPLLAEIKKWIAESNFSPETKERLTKLAELGYIMDAEGAGKYAGSSNGPQGPVGNRIQEYIKGVKEGRIPEKSAAAIIAKSAPDIKEPYKRPPRATTQQQRDSAQGIPCSTCGKITPKQFAN